MVRWLRKSFSLALAAVMMTVLVLPSPAMAGDRYYGDYYGGSYGSSNWGKGVEKGGGELGRSLGGAMGMAVGAIGGAALASAVVKAAGIAAMGPLATVLTISAITAGSLFLGSKVFSTLGQSLERSMGAKNLWTMIGAAGGAVAAIALLGTAGVFAGPAGLLFKALIGGVVGGSIARLLSGVLETVATPRILYAAVGGLIAAVGGMGFAGAIGGIAFGYVIGSIMDSVYFADRNRTLKGYVNEGRYKAGNIFDKLSYSVNRVKAWVSGKLGRAGNAVRRNWDEDYSNPYYKQYYDRGYSTGYDYNRPRYTVDYRRSGGNSSLSASYNSRNDAYNTFLRLNNNPGASADERYRALENYRRSNMEYMNNRTGYDYGSDWQYGY